MKKKLGLLSFVVAVIALASMGMSYATEEHVVFWGPVVSSDSDGVNGGEVENAYVNQTGVLIISILHAYPGYEAYIDFSFKNSSSNEKEYYYKGFDVYDYDATALDIVVSGIDTGVLYPGTVYNGRLTIILGNVEEYQSYSFGLDIDFSDEPN